MAIPIREVREFPSLPLCKDAVKQMPFNPVLGHFEMTPNTIGYLSGLCFAGTRIWRKVHLSREDPVAPHQIPVSTIRSNTSVSV